MDTNTHLVSTRIFIKYDPRDPIVYIFNFLKILCHHFKSNVTSKSSDNRDRGNISNQYFILTQVLYKIWPTWPNRLHFEFYVIFYFFYTLSDHINNNVTSNSSGNKNDGALQSLTRVTPSSTFQILFFLELQSDIKFRNQVMFIYIFLVTYFLVCLHPIEQSLTFVT